MPLTPALSPSTGRGDGAAGERRSPTARVSCAAESFTDPTGGLSLALQGHAATPERASARFRYRPPALAAGAVRCASRDPGRVRLRSEARGRMEGLEWLSWCPGSTGS